jgi:uncharacterized protein YraI
MNRSWALRLVLATAVTATTVFGLPEIANAATGTVNTAGSALTVRAAPGTSYDAWGSVADGARVTILCQTSGSSVTGPYGTSTVWDMLSSGGFVSDAYIYTGSDGTVEHACSYAGAPARANPRTANAAISWEFARLGSTGDEGMCMRFQAQAYGWSHSGWDTAEVGGDWIEAHNLMRSGVPPRGALVWYHNSSGSGHVVVSLGEGKIIGTSVTNRVGVGNYLYHSGYRGWSVPYFPAAS